MTAIKEKKPKGKQAKRSDLTKEAEAVKNSTMPLAVANIGESVQIELQIHYYAINTGHLLLSSFQMVHMGFICSLAIPGHLRALSSYTNHTLKHGQNTLCQKQHYGSGAMRLDGPQSILY